MITTETNSPKRPRQSAANAAVFAAEGSEPGHHHSVASGESPLNAAPRATSGPFTTTSNASAMILATSTIFTVVYTCPAVTSTPTMIAVTASGRPRIVPPGVAVRPNAARPSKSPTSGSTGIQNRSVRTNAVTAMPLMGFISAWFVSVNAASAFMCSSFLCVWQTPGW